MILSMCVILNVNWVHPHKKKWVILSKLNMRLDTTTCIVKLNVNWIHLARLDIEEINLGMLQQSNFLEAWINNKTQEWARQMSLELHGGCRRVNPSRCVGDDDSLCRELGYCDSGYMKTADEFFWEIPKTRNTFLGLPIPPKEDGGVMAWQTRKWVWV